jgi:protein gp37
MQRTKIPWCDYTWNPVRGCYPVSEGCANCYAARIASRFSGPGMPFEGLAEKGKWTGKTREIDKYFGAPQKPARIFVCSMSDLFYENCGYHPSYRVICAAKDNPKHTFIILTKRPKRLFVIGKILASDGFKEWPPNIWLGVSVENQKRAAERIPYLLDSPAKTKFVSVEPMLGPVDLSAYLHGLDWIICGSESGPKARPFDLGWARLLGRETRRANVPFFFKQAPHPIDDDKTIEMPKLDGVIWDMFPDKAEGAL